MHSPSLCRVAVVPLCLVSGLAAQTAPPATAPDARAVEIRELRAEVERISARLAQLEAADHAPATQPAAQPDTAHASSSPPPAAAAPGMTAAPGTTAAGMTTRAGSGAAAAAAANPAAAGSAVASGPALASAVVPASGVGGSSNAGASTSPPAVPTLTAADGPTLNFFRGTTINVAVDGYYLYNFNEPIGRVNLLRAYTVSSNSFSLSQASLILERLPTVESRVGGRIDLQFRPDHRDAPGIERKRAATAGVAQYLPGVWQLSGAGRVRVADRLRQVCEFAGQ